MIGFIYKKVFDVLRRKPIKLWGLSLLCSFLTVLASIFGFLPIIVLPLTWALECGLSMVLLNAYRKGTEPETDDLFIPFKQNFLHIVGGMAWMQLWILIWALIPFAGIVMAVIKAYEYRFTPYILMTEPEVSATQALKKSMQITNGYKGKMFGADVLAYALVFAAYLVLSLLSMIPYIGVLFAIITFVLSLLVMAFGTLFFGLLSAAFYEEITTMTQEKYESFTKPRYVPAAAQPYQEPTKTCPNCGETVSANAKFCGKCGTPVE